MSDIPVGTRIVCPKCGEVVAEVVRELRARELVTADCFRVYRGEWRDGECPCCTSCGFPLMIETGAGALIHTEHGWMPGKWPTFLFMNKLVRYLKRHGMWREEWGRRRRQR